MDISVQDLNSVDKELIIKANREDLEPKFKAAYKKYRNQINMPGFRPGKVPVSLIRKRFGDEIEYEEINKYIQEVFEKEVVPEYEPVGETQMIDLSWEDGELEAKFKIGAAPEFELADLDKVEVDKMVHDVKDEEVEEEIERMLEREGNWEETDGEITEKNKVIVDAVALDDEGKPVEGDKEEDQELDLRQEGNAEFKEALLGKKAGDEVEVEFGDDDETEKFRLNVKKVQELSQVELTDEFAKAQSDGEAKNVDEFKAFVKSRIQNYYDQVADDMIRNELVENMVDAHDFEVPEVFLEQVLNNYVQRVKQQSGGQLPPDFDEEGYKESMKERASRDGKWYFINQKLQEKFEDIEIKPEDIDEYIAAEAARYGISTDQMKNLFAQNPDQLENLRSSIRENKVFDRLQDEVKINEISKEEYQEKREAESEAVDED